MDYQINRFVIDVPNGDEKSSIDQLDMDFFLQCWGKVPHTCPSVWSPLDCIAKRGCHTTITDD